MVEQRQKAFIESEMALFNVPGEVLANVCKLTLDRASAFIDVHLPLDGHFYAVATGRLLTSNIFTLSRVRLSS
jgi:hypothetical protein